jgi:hypothetical protein
LCAWRYPPDPKGVLALEKGPCAIGDASLDGDPDIEALLLHTRPTLTVVNGHQWITTPFAGPCSFARALPPVSPSLLPPLERSLAV